MTKHCQQPAKITHWPCAFSSISGDLCDSTQQYGVPASFPRYYENQLQAYSLGASIRRVPATLFPKTHCPPTTLINNRLIHPRLYHTILLTNNNWTTQGLQHLMKHSPKKLCDGAQIANFWRFFCVLYLQRAAYSTFQTCILNSH